MKTFKGIPIKGTLFEQRNNHAWLDQFHASPGDIVVHKDRPMEQLKVVVHMAARNAVSVKPHVPGEALETISPTTYNHKDLYHV
jgi:hypothetical protein